MRLRSNRRGYRYSPVGLPVPRVWHRASRGKWSPRLLVKCPARGYASQCSTFLPGHSHLYRAA